MRSGRLAAALVLIATVLVAAPQGRGEIIEEIVAKVNDEIITKSDFEQEEQGLIAELYRRYTGPDLDEQVKLARQTLLERMIDRKILLHRAERLYDMDMMREAMLDMFMRQQEIESKEELERLLAQEGLTVEELERRLVEMYAPEEVLRFEVVDRVSIGDKEIEEYYRSHQEEFQVPAEVTLREIVLLVDDEAGKEERRAEAEAAHQRVTAGGEDFAQVAQESSGAGSAAEGGRIGPFQKGDLAPALESVAFEVPVGEVGPIVETEHGFHILKVEERREMRVKDLDEVREELRNRIENEKYNEGIAEFVKKAREEADIWVSPKYADRYVLQNE